VTIFYQWISKGEIGREEWKMNYGIENKNNKCFQMLCGSLSPWHGVFLGCRWRRWLPDMKIAANILNKQFQTADKGWSSSLDVG